MANTEIIIKRFLEHKKKLDDARRNNSGSDGENTYDHEFQKIRELSLSYKTDNVYSFAEGMKSCNVSKNKFKDIVPFDYTRVKLKNLKSGSTSDYINASFIKGAMKDQAYIAAQGPLPTTVNDFWQMIWENKVKVIFIACREYDGDSSGDKEGMRSKCQRYWPNGIEEMVFGDVVLNLVKEEKLEEFDEQNFVRHLVARVGNERREVVQFHYWDWPDAGAPRNIQGVTHLIDRMREAQPIDARETPPIVIHCSAGCGRTGSILVIDFVTSLLKIGKVPSNFSLFDIINELRRQRMSTVQTLEQYIFVHEVVADIFNRYTEIPAYATVDKNQKPPQVKKPPIAKRPSQDVARERAPAVVPDMEIPYEVVDKPSNFSSHSAVAVAYEFPTKLTNRTPDGKDGGAAELRPQPTRKQPARIPSMSLAQVIYKGIDISYPNRISQKPRGKRPLKTCN